MAMRPTGIPAWANRLRIHRMNVDFPIDGRAAHNLRLRLAPPADVVLKLLEKFLEVGE